MNPNTLPPIQNFNVVYQASTLTYNFGLAERVSNAKFWLKSQNSDQILDAGILTGSHQTRTISIPHGLEPESRYLLTVSEGSRRVQSSTVAAFTSSWTTTGTAPPAVLNLGVSSTSTYVTIPGEKMNTQLSKNGGSLTLMTWVKTSGYAAANNKEIDLIGADFVGDLQSSSLYLRIVNGNYVFGTFAPSSSVPQNEIVSAGYVEVSAPIVTGDDGNWVHLCGQFNNATRKWSLYRNSFLLASTTGPAYTPTSASWYMGGRKNGAPPNCAVELKGVWILGSAIAPRQLRDRYFAVYGSLPSGLPSTDNLIAYWPLNEGSGQKITDLSSVTPTANGTWSDTNITWGNDFNLGTLGFVNGGDSFASTINGFVTSKSNPLTIFVEGGTYPTDPKASVAKLNYVTLVGSGQDNTMISAILNCTNIAGIRQLSLAYAGSDATSDGRISALYSSGILTMDRVDVSCTRTTTATPNPLFVSSALLTPNSSGVILSNCQFTATTPNSYDYIAVITIWNSNPATANNCQFITGSSPEVPAIYGVYAVTTCQLTLNSCSISTPYGNTLVTDSTAKIIANNCGLDGYPPIGNVQVNSTTAMYDRRSEKASFRLDLKISLVQQSDALDGHLADKLAHY